MRAFADLSAAAIALGQRSLKHLGDETRAAVREESLHFGQSFLFIALIVLTAGTAYGAFVTAFYWWCEAYFSPAAAMALTGLLGAVLAGALALVWRRVSAASNAPRKN